MMDHSRIRPTTFVAQVLWNEHTRAIENATTGRMSPADALAAAQKEVQRELDAVYNKETHPVVDLKIPLMIFGLLVLSAIGAAILFII
ncbi:hypothetical protein ABTM67_19765, partial [Acinetobacter baumannii]